MNGLFYNNVNGVVNFAHENDSRALLVNLQLAIVQGGCSDVWNQLWNQFQDLILSLICKPDE